jgi:hypothetical protein
MILDRTHLRWGLATLTASAAATFLYVANTEPEVLPVPVNLPAWFGPVPPLRGNFGATPLGLAFGTLALLIFLFAVLLGWRRSHPTWKVGRMQVWLKAHIWLTILTLPLVLFHCGFRVGGPMTQILFWLYALVMVSGFLGLALQQVMPRLMRNYLPEEIIFDEIPFVLGQILAQAEAMREHLARQAEEPTLHAAATGGGTATATINQAHVISTCLHFLDQEALPYLRSPKPLRFRLRDKTASDDLFRLLTLQVPEGIHPVLEQLQTLCDEKRRIDLQIRLQYWLHLWLLVHAPASLLLVVLTILHAIVAAYLYA